MADGSADRDRQKGLKMTRTDKKRRLDAFVSNDNNFVAVAYDDPRAVAIRAKAGKLTIRRVAAQNAAKAASKAAAAAFEIGQQVKVINRPTVVGRVVLIKGDFVKLNTGATYVAAALAAV